MMNCHYHLVLMMMMMMMMVVVVVVVHWYCHYCVMPDVSLAVGVVTCSPSEVHVVDR